MVGFHYNGADYYFEKNLQGDITAIYNSSGQKQAEYIYDAWGNIIRIMDASGDNITDASHVGNVNPFRYRGYYYDVETGLYYLESRYYDPEVGRFLNADSLEYLGEGSDLQNHNLYAYCENNPVMGIDPAGKFGLAIALFIGIAAIVGGGVGALTAASTGGNVVEGAIEGLLTGAIAATATVFVPQLVAIILPSTLGAVATTAIATAATVTVAGLFGMGTDIAIQGVSHALSENSKESFAVDWSRVVKTGIMTGISSAVPTILDPTKSLTNAFGAAIVGMDAAIINAFLDIIFTTIL